MSAVVAAPAWLLDASRPLSRGGVRSCLTASVGSGGGALLRRSFVGVAPPRRLGDGGRGGGSISHTLRKGVVPPQPRAPKRILLRWAVGPWFTVVQCRRTLLRSSVDSRELTRRGFEPQFCGSARAGQTTEPSAGRKPAARGPKNKI